MDAIEESDVSLSDIMSRPLSRSDDARSAGLTFEQRAEVRGWLVQVFREIHRVTRAVEQRARAADPIRTDSLESRSALELSCALAEFHWNRGA